MRILVVEDDELTVQTLTTVLTQQNYALEIATDGEAGWELAESFTFDLILLDVMMPRVNGLELCRRLRSHGSQVPILLLTGRDSGHDKAVGLDAGADDYVVKPFDPEELVARIRALLRRGGATVQPTLAWGDLRLDPSTCQVNYNDAPLALTPKEYALLELFLRNSRRVFSCGLILEHIWSFEDTPGEEAVRTHIKGLRHKLKQAGAPADLVETVYGIGYRLKPLTEDEGKSKPGKTAKGGKKSKGDQAQESPTVQPAIASPTVPSTASPPSPTRQQTLAAIAEVWQRLKPKVKQQVDVLEQAAIALHDCHLSQELHQQAEREAHTLAGSLGTFGFAAGSTLARQIEHLLQGQQLKQSDGHRLQILVSALREEIFSTTGESTTAADPPRSTILAPRPDQVSSDRISDNQIRSDRIPPAKVMVVDDDPKILAVLQALLEPWGLHLTTLDDPRQFWPTLAHVSPDLLILDLNMPHHDGIELCQAVRESDEWSSLPIMILTAYTDDVTVNRVFAVGADDFVSKPIVGPELVTRIVNRMERVRLLRRLSSGQSADTRPTVTENSQPVPAIAPPDQEERFFNMSLDLLCIADFNGYFKRVNPAFEKVLGYAPEDLTERSFLDLIHPDDLDNTRHELAQLAAGIPAIDFENRYLCRDGSYKWLSWHSMPVVDEGITYAVARDITERKRQEEAWHKNRDAIELRVAERTAELVSLTQRLQRELDTAKRLETERNQVELALRLSQARFAGILEIADDAIISIDGTQQITLFNQGAEKIFGYTAQEVLGKPLDILLPLESVHVHRRHVNEFGVHESGQARRMGERRPIFGRRKDGTEFPAEASISRLEQGGEKVFTVILRDITERQKVDRMKDEFISVVSHELRTPLTSIHGSLGMLASGLLSAESERGKRLLQIAVESTDRLVRLINDILDIERIESGKVQMVKEGCNVADLIAAAIDEVQAIADKAGILLDVSNLLVDVIADGDRIIQTLTNLLSNAIKFSNRGSTVWLSVELKSDPSPYLLFTVKDQGRGIPPDKLEAIFERFQQVDASDSRRQDGTGLGLAICRSIVQQHGGKIWVESTSGAGSTFLFTLPFSRQE